MKKRILLILLLLILIPTFWGFLENGALEVNEIPVTSNALPESFRGFRIAHVSDLHNAEFGNENERLLELLQESEPDLIAITGDLIDSRNTDVDIALAFVREAVKIAPCCYVTGNHESRVKEYTILEAGLLEAGVTVLRNGSTTIGREGESICLAGVDDPTFGGTDALKQNLSQMSSEDFTLLLSHRPELFEYYCDYGYDLVLSGHAHGGQFRLPFLGGLIAPHQGWFPKYDAGLYTQGETNMVVSRGLGNSLFPFRLNNPPEVILITLAKESAAN